MSFEFDLVPRPPKAAFEQQDLADMRAWWDRFPTAVAPDGSLLVFPSEEVRDLRLERRQHEPGKNDYLTPHVNLDPKRVQLSVVGDEVTDRWFYDFAKWSQARFTCELEYFGEPVPTDDILAASES